MYLVHSKHLLTGHIYYFQIIIIIIIIQKDLQQCDSYLSVKVMIFL